MAKKKSCQNIHNPRVLSAAERDLYGWVDAEVFTQSSVISSDDLPELRREMRLTEDVASERDYVIEAVGPSDRLPLQAPEDRTHFLWVYVELFTCLGVRLPFTDFQREVLTRCRVATSQLHLNGWGFLHTFERVCLHFGFRPSWCIFLYTYQLHAPPPRNGFYLSVLTKGDGFLTPLRSLFRNSNGTTSSHPFWLDDEGKPFPWVYWNPEARECRITTLDPLETLAFQFLQSLPVGLGKKSNFKCRWILDHSDADIGAFLGIVEGMGPHSILPHTRALGATSGASGSNLVAPVSTPAASVPPVPPSGAVKARKKPSVASSGKPFSEHEVNPIDRAFPTDYNFRAALDAGLMQGPIREILGPLVPEQLIGTAQYLACKLTACLQVDVLTAERDSALAAPLLNSKIKSLSQELELAEGGRLSTFVRMKEVEEGAKVQAAELESCHFVLEQERKKESRRRWTRPRPPWFIGVDPKAKRIYNPKVETLEQPEPAVEDQPEPAAEEQPEVLAEQQVEETVAGEGSRNVATFDGAEFVGAFSECFDHPVGAFPICS
ncbi:hypothetical protein PIB30_077279 [Stylosanthes scabra]|uniref:Uncharacterized protein n=1 Tax=Stylosanthes scabra TaxID=79078 RepID=A0ABU6XNH1_9FABA|nr:hypothetical protein [Stylosanthes scabra]